MTLAGHHVNTLLGSKYQVVTPSSDTWAESTTKFHFLQLSHDTSHQWARRKIKDIFCIFQWLIYAYPAANVISIDQEFYVCMCKNQGGTHVLMKSMACALSWSALCRSASIRMSAAFSIDRLVHSASSHITLSLSSAYCQQHTQSSTIQVVVQTESAASNPVKFVLGLN